MAAMPYSCLTDSHPTQGETTLPLLVDLSATTATVSSKESCHGVTVLDCTEGIVLGARSVFYSGVGLSAKRAVDMF